MSKFRKIMNRYVLPLIPVAFLGGLGVYDVASEHYHKNKMKAAAQVEAARHLKAPVETLEVSVEKLHDPGDGKSPHVKDRNGNLIGLDMSVNLGGDYVILKGKGLEYRIIDNGMGHSLGKKAVLKIQKEYYDKNDNHVIDSADRLWQTRIEIDGKYVFTDGGIYRKFFDAFPIDDSALNKVK